MNPSSRVPARWILPPALPPEVAGLGVAQRVLWTRGYRDEQSARLFLQPSVDAMYDPLLLRDMDRAVDRICRAVRDREPILLYGDYDVDGTTSIVVLKKTLDLLGARAEYFIPDRLKDGYGMRTDAIDRAAAAGVRLIVSVDTGIRAGAVVEHARALGIDVVVTDHHLPEAELPRAVAVINPNREDCEYPDKNLCGAAVTLKLVQALLRGMGEPPERVRRLVDSFLKVVALATVADVVPLVGENRVIVKCGLDGFSAVKNAGLRALLRVAGFKDGDCPTAGQVAFRIAPRINAAGRMANAGGVIEMFLTGDPERARAIAEQLHDLNADRQDTEKAIVEECKQIPVTNADAGLVYAGAGWHKGVVGIVASRLVDCYHRPVVVLAVDEESGVASGSGRSIPGFHLLEALESMRGLFTKFGGHKQAAGVTLPVSAVPEFRERFNAYAQARLGPGDFRRAIEIDAVLDLAEISDATVRDVARLAPFGFGNPAPVLCVRDVEIAGVSVPEAEKRPVSIGLRQGGKTVIATGWDWRDRLGEIERGRRVDAALCLEEAGKDGRWRALLKDVQDAGAAASAAVR